MSLGFGMLVIEERVYGWLSTVSISLRYCQALPSTHDRVRPDGARGQILPPNAKTLKLGSGQFYVADPVYCEYYPKLSRGIISSIDIYAAYTPFPRILRSQNSLTCRIGHGDWI